jgi:hypothetical protein
MVNGVMKLKSLASVVLSFLSLAAMADLSVERGRWRRKTRGRFCVASVAASA